MFKAPNTRGVSICAEVLDPLNWADACQWYGEDVMTWIKFAGNIWYIDIVCIYNNYNILLYI